MKIDNDSFHRPKSVFMASFKIFQVPIQVGGPPEPPTRQQSINTMKNLSPITNAYNQALIETTKVQSPPKLCVKYESENHNITMFWTNEDLKLI